MTQCANSVSDVGLMDKCIKQFSFGGAWDPDVTEIGSSSLDSSAFRNPVRQPYHDRPVGAGPTSCTTPAEGSSHSGTSAPCRGETLRVATHDNNINNNNVY